MGHRHVPPSDPRRPARRIPEGAGYPSPCPVHPGRRRGERSPHVGIPGRELPRPNSSHRVAHEATPPGIALAGPDLVRRVEAVMEATRHRAKIGRAGAMAVTGSIAYTPAATKTRRFLRWRSVRRAGRRSIGPRRREADLARRHQIVATIRGPPAARYDIAVRHARPRRQTHR